MRNDFTNKELEHLEQIKDNLIIELFSTMDKRYTLEKAIKKAYLIGREKTTDVIM